MTRQGGTEEKNSIRIGLPISDLHLLLAVSRRVNDLSASDQLLHPSELKLAADLLRDIMEGYENGISTLYSSRVDPRSEA